MSPRPLLSSLRARVARGGGRRSLRRAAIAFPLIVITGLGTTIASGRDPAPPIGPVDPQLLARVVPPERTAADAPRPLGTPAPIDLDAIAEFAPDARSFEPRPAPALPQSVGVIVKPTPTPRPTPRPQVASTGGGGGGGGTTTSGHRVSGRASWYCLSGVSACHYQYSGGLYAAAGPALRVGSWRGRSVRVCGNGNCVTVRLIDWCACPSAGRVIDLYSDAFRRLAPLSSGTVAVTVTW